MQRQTRIGGFALTALLTVAGCAADPVPALSTHDLPPAVAAAVSAERADALPLSSFYATPDTLAGTEPGALLAQEPGTGYDLPEGVSASRILYHSLDATGHDVATSGVTLIPAGAAPLTVGPSSPGLTAPAA